MKKTTFFVSNKTHIFCTLLTTLLLICACTDKNKIMGRPPGILTSEQESNRHEKTEATSSDQTRKKRKGKSHFNDGNIVDWDTDADWNESKALDVWNTGARNYSPIFEIEGWPYQESGSSFRILWKGSSTTVPIYKNPTLNERSKESVSFEKGEEIGWVSTYVAVLSPSLYRAKDDILIEGFEVFSEGFTKGDDGFSKILKKGATLRLLLYIGDSLCYVGISGKPVQTLCPTSESFHGNFRGRDLREQMQPASRMWWIELEGGKGWIVLDNKYIVEIR